MICADELGPVTPRTFPPEPGWSPDGHRIKAELDYSRGPEKTWVYGGLRPADGQAVTMTASSRNSVFYQQFLQLIEDANPAGGIWIVTDNLSSHNSVSTRTGSRSIPAFTMPSSLWVRAGSTPGQSPGSGADPHRELAYCEADTCTPFEEPSTSKAPQDVLLLGLFYPRRDTVENYQEELFSL